MGLGTGTVLVVVGLLLSAGWVDPPGVLGETALHRAILALGVLLAVAGVVAHILRDRARLSPRVRP